MKQHPQWAKAFSLSRIHYRIQLDKPHSVGLLWTSDQFVADTSTRQHTTLTDIYAPGGIRNHYPRKRGAADQSLRPRGHWDRHKFIIK